MFGIRMSRRTPAVLLLGVASLSLGLVLPAFAAKNVPAAPITSGETYDRNPSVVVDGKRTWMFFARSQEDECNRLETCNADNTQYDLYYKVSTNGGKTFGLATFVAANPDGATGPFRGRTIAATQIESGPNQGVYVFWASGANSLGPAYYVKMTTAGAVTVPPTPVPGTELTPAGSIFNVEAVAEGQDIYLYTEECCAAPGIHARKFDGATVTDGPTLVAADLSLPKAIIDKHGMYRMTMVSGYT
jgi:hypothetical protein